MWIINSDWKKPKKLTNNCEWFRDGAFSWPIWIKFFRKIFQSERKTEDIICYDYRRSPNSIRNVSFRHEQALSIFLIFQLYIHKIFERYSDECLRCKDSGWLQHQSAQILFSGCEKIWGTETLLILPHLIFYGLNESNVDLKEFFLTTIRLSRFLPLFLNFLRQ